MCCASVIQYSIQRSKVLLDRTRTSSTETVQLAVYLNVKKVLGKPNSTQQHVQCISGTKTRSVARSSRGKSSVLILFCSIEEFNGQR